MDDRIGEPSLSVFQPPDALYNIAPTHNDPNFQENVSYLDHPAKRKRSESKPEPTKRHKWDLTKNAGNPNPSSCKGLPVEVWQQVFLYLPPWTLARLLQVNRLFNYCLTGVVGEDMGSASGRLRILPSESVWACSRRVHHPNLPKPLAACSELEMWRLLLGKRCDFCTKHASSPGSADKPWEAGPGDGGVRLIWPFAMRACGDCLVRQCQKESALLFTSLSAFLPALPFIFLTSAKHFVPSIVVQNEVVPPSIKISKWYYESHIEDLRTKFDHVKSLGPAAAEEWFKGIETAGRDRMLDASRWERWELKGGLDSFVKEFFESNRWTASKIRSREPQGYPITLSSRTDLSDPPREVLQPLPYRPEQVGQAMSYQSFPPAGPFPNARVERNLKDVNEAKAARRADIERRCLALQPPILPRVLRHMESFQAAIQISQPLNDAAWEVLKPRLLAQREQAEKTEQEHSAHMLAIQTKLLERRQQDPSSKEARDHLDREREDARRPLREQLASYADQFIQSRWAGGKAVSKGNVARFAAELLLHVREAFHEHASNADATSQEAKDIHPLTPSADNPLQKLVLEDMKWVFDNKIKPLTDHLRKELFLCAICESNHKFYGFEGIIQHYGAKHTNAFSLGNIVVHWQSAEWPLEPPFHLHPESVKSSFHGNPGAAVPNQVQNGSAAYSPYHYGGYTRGTTTTPQVGPMGPYPAPQISPAPFAQAIYPMNMQGPFVPPPVNPGSYPYGLQSPQMGYSPVPMATFQPQYSYQPNFQNGSHNAEHVANRNQMSPPGSTYLNQGLPRPSGNPLDLQGSATATQLDQQATAPLPQHSHQVPPTDNSISELARRTLNTLHVAEVAKIAHKAWSDLSDVKDIPESVRIYAIIRHVFPRFKAAFGVEPSLDTFIDCLENSVLMGPMKNVSGLACKACLSNDREKASSHQFSTFSLNGRKLYDLLSLFLHFRSVHVWAAKSASPTSGHIDLPCVDWKENLIDLPDPGWLDGLARDAGADNQKLQVIADAFPSLFDQHSPQMRSQVLSRATNRTDPVVKLERDELMDTGVQVAETKDGPLVKSEQSVDTSPREQRLQSLPAFGDDEYDPRRPALELEPDSPRRARMTQRVRRPPSGELEDYIYVVERNVGGRSSHPERYVRRAHHGPGSCSTLPQAGRMDLFDVHPPSKLRGDLVEIAGPRRGRDPFPGLAAHSSSQQYNVPQDDAIEIGHLYHPYVREPLRRSTPLKRAESADRFLNDISPQDAKLRDMQLTEQDVRDELLIKEPRQTAAEPEGAALGKSHHMLPTKPNGIGNGHTSAQDHPGPSVGIDDRYTVSPTFDPQGSAGPEPGQAHNSGAHPRKSSSYRHMPAKFARYSNVLPDESREVRVARPHSRYERYEAQRRQLDRERTRSPARPSDQTAQASYRTRSRSPDLEARGPYRSRYVYDLPGRHASLDQQELHPQAIPLRDYRFAGASHGGAEYEGPVHYLRFTEARPEARLIHRGADELVEYVPYERGVRAPLYVDRDYYYYETQEDSDQRRSAH